MKKSFPWFGAALMVVGAAMLLQRLHLVSLGWGAGFCILLTVAGIVMLVRGFAARRKKRIFWGWVWTAAGGYFSLDQLGIVAVPEHLVVPGLLLITGIGFLLLVVRDPAEWYWGVPGLAFAVLGGAIIGAEEGWVGSENVRSAIQQVWPVALILFGAGLLLNGRRTYKGG